MVRMNKMADATKSIRDTKQRLIGNGWVKIYYAHSKHRKLK